ncbi:hypothetical protein FH972_026889 [Carpinus fangiana]|uniref:Uncharacterized protein n=1 Tax=Carpinus fangiana TaxID=176857 RepID=A0A5N6L5D0_9ROSI|nr:hypothetical protein FH972_026889 [Carpinus fangiana]
MASLNYRKLRTSDNASIVQYFRELTEVWTILAITKHILHGVETSAVPPYITSIWLTFAKSPEVTALAIKQDFSVQVRRIGLKHVGWLLKHWDTRPIRDALGDTEALVTMFNTLSVDEVKHLSTALRSRSGRTFQSSQQWVDEICKAVMSDHGLDARPIHALYSSLLRACSADARADILNDKPELQHSQSNPLDINSCRQVVIDALYTGDQLPPITNQLLHCLPHGPRNASGLTPSMEFSIDVLARISTTTGPPTKMSNYFFFDVLVLPLVRRIYRKDGKSDKHGIMAQILEHVVKYLSKNFLAVNHIKYAKNRELGFIAVVCWSYNHQLKSSLCKLIKAQHLEKSQDIEKYRSCFDNIALNRRIPFLKLILENSKPRATVIDSVQSLRGSSIEKWPVWLFQSIPRKDAFKLLSRLMNAKSDSFLSSHVQNSVARKHSMPGNGHAEEGLLFTLLDRNNDGALIQVTNSVNSLKRKAQTAREQSDRATFAKGALHYSIASGSPEIYLTTVRWAERFLRDPLTFSELFQNSLHLAESQDILVGIPNFDRTGGISRAEFVVDVKHATETAAINIPLANEIILTLFHFACASLREPWFQAYHWEAVLNLPSVIAELRLERIAPLQNHVQQAILNSTKDLLLDIEAQALEPGNEKLGWFKERHVGKLDRRPFHMTSSAALFFLDDLARSRNDLWNKYRSRQNPAVAALPVPFARGLPLVHLLQPFQRTGTHILDLASDKFLPYISSRAEELVFMSTEIARSHCPEFQEIGEAILPFLDSYSLALRIYILGKDAMQRPETIKKAWQHAIKSFDEPDSSTQESQQKWESIFRRALGRAVEDIIIPKKAEEYCLRLPLEEFSAEPVEWDPAWKRLPFREDKPVPIRTIDWFTCMSFSDSLYLNSTPFPGKVPCPVIKGYQPPRIWGECTSFDEREAVVASTMLYLDAPFKSFRRIFLEPFPATSESPRYPAMFLDEMFLTRKELSRHSALLQLESLIGLIPPILLEHVALSAFEDLQQTPIESASFHETEALALKLLKLLTKSDRPRLAISLIAFVLLKLPQASSWHREIFTLGFLRRLSHKEAHDLVKSIARATANEPFVKVSTVKFLAQLMNGANFVAPSLAIEVLGEILEETKHIDIRHAATESLLDVLVTCTDTLLAERIMEILKQLERVAGTFNERYPMSENDWKAAEVKKELPEPYSVRGGPPILNEILSAPAKFQLGSAVSRQQFFDQIIVPVVLRSCNTNARWMHIFCRIHGISDSAHLLPAAPVHPCAFHSIFSRDLSYLSDEWLAIRHVRFMFALSPPPSIGAVDFKVRHDRKLKQGAESHWLSYYDSLSFQSSAHLLNNELLPATSDSVTLATLHDNVSREIRVILDSSSLISKHWHKILDQFAYERSATSNYCRWTKHTKPVIQTTISYMESLIHSKEIPSIYTVRLLLVVIPHGNDESTQDQCDDYSRLIRDFVDTYVISADQTPYHKRFSQLQQHMLKNSSPDEKIRVALRLGVLPNCAKFQLSDYLCIELADSLLQHAKSWFQRKSDELAMLLSAWKQCDDEYVCAFGQEWHSRKDICWTQ